MRKEDVRGLNREGIKDNWSIKDVPDQMGEVNVPTGTLVREGSAAENAFGSGGGEQFQLMEEIPNSSFGTPSPIPETTGTGPVEMEGVEPFEEGFEPVDPEIIIP
jgi:hypothetical protein